MTRPRKQPTAGSSSASPTEVVLDNRVAEADLLAIGRAVLNAQQADVIKECLIKGSGGLSVPMGFGKTLLSIVLGLESRSLMSKNEIQQPPLLIVVSKTLLASWKFEIEKFFGSLFKYAIWHPDAIKDLDTCPIDLRGLDAVLTTADVVAKYYKDAHIEASFVEHLVVNEGQFNQHIILKYRRPVEPWRAPAAVLARSAADNTEEQKEEQHVGGKTLFAVRWAMLIVDEVQKYTNINSLRCKGLGAICAASRWGMSGTIFDEPKPERILGYYVIINDKKFPRTLPAATTLVYSRRFKGFRESIVHRETNAAFDASNIKVNKTIVTHELSKEEEMLYRSLKDTMKKIGDELRRFQELEDVENARRFSSYLMAMLCYLRQCVVCPILPLAKAALDISDFANKSQLSEMLLHSSGESALGTWLEREESAKSSRIAKALEVLEKHADERAIVFTCFRTCLDIAQHFLKKERPDRKSFTITSTMNMKSRAATLQDFAASDNGVLFMTYELGAEGLNLQSCATMLLLDFWWNNGKTMQATARILRYGQLAREVNLYYFMSNTGVEKAVFQKQFDKKNMLAELHDGPMVTKCASIQIKEIIKLIDTEDNVRLLGATAF